MHENRKEPPERSEVQLFPAHAESKEFCKAKYIFFRAQTAQSACLNAVKSDYIHARYYKHAFTA
jgi:hypothetical protein